MRLLTTLLLFTGLLFSVEFGTVIKVKGEVKVGEELLEKGMKIEIGDIITTGPKAKVLIKFRNSNIVVNHNSALTIKEEDFVEQTQGESFYSIAPLKKFIDEKVPNRFRIKTKTSTIGIRGTNFIVKAATKESVLLRDGQLAITSLKDEFKLFKQKELAEFEKYKSQMNTEFEAYKNKQQFEFEAYKKEFELYKNTVVTIDGENAYKASFTEDIKKSFDEYDEFIDN